MGLTPHPLPWLKERKIMITKYEMTMVDDYRSNYTPASEYKLPQFYSIDERVRIIKHELANGNDFYKIGDMFGVGWRTIKYHYDRYVLEKPHKKSNKKSAAKYDGEIPAYLYVYAR